MVYNISVSQEKGTEIKIMKENTRKRTVNLVLAALFTAVTAVLSQTAIPTPFDVPLTLQTFAVALCGYTLGIKWGMASIAAYILLGTVGVPVFSGFRGGAQVLFGATGGFIFGFLLLTLFCGFCALIKNKYLKFLPGLAGLALCHIWGTAQYAVIYKMKPVPAFLLVSAPYLIKDVLSVIAAYILSVYIIKLIKKIR